MYGEWVWGDNLEGAIAWGREDGGSDEWMAELEKTINTFETLGGGMSSSCKLFGYVDKD